jgi:broad specificity phosphatase PhoE
MSILYLIRHGQASFGKDNYDELSSLGTRQARILGENLIAVGHKFDAVFCGKMTRQLQTATQVINCFLENDVPFPTPILLNAFNEYDAFSIWDQRVGRMLARNPELKDTIDQARTDPRLFQKIFEQVMTQWAKGLHDEAGDDTWQGFIEKVQSGLEMILRDHSGGQHVAIFTSGGPIGVVVKQALELSRAKAMEISWQVMNASVTRFFFSKRGLFLAGFNDISHLVQKNDSTLMTYR